MTGAWQGFLLWAVRQQQIRRQYEEATGQKIGYGWDAEGNPTDEGLLDFTYWVTLYHWGPEGVPEKFTEDARARFESGDQDQQ